MVTFSSAEDATAGILTGAALFAPVLVPFILPGMAIVLVLVISLLLRVGRQAFKRLFQWLGLSWSGSAMAPLQGTAALHFIKQYFTIFLIDFDILY